VSATTKTTPRVLDFRMERIAKVSAYIALAVVAASFVYSYEQIKWVSDQLGAEPAELSYLFPFIIDLPALIASALTVALHDRPTRQRAYAWSILATFTTLSCVCNAVHAVSHSPLLAQWQHAGWAYLLVIVVAGFPPIGVVLGMHMWAYALRHSPASGAPAPKVSAQTERPSARRSPAVSGASERPRPTVSGPSERPTERPQVAAAQSTSAQSVSETIAQPPAQPPAQSLALVPDGEDADDSMIDKDEAIKTLRAIFRDMIEKGQTIKPRAPEVIAASKIDGVAPATFRRWITEAWDAEIAAAA
jgi:hypothetical protein